MDRPLTQEEVNGVHAQIEQAVVHQLKGRIR
jgi:phenylalanyl-tRNA synthetase beta subunit